MDPTPPWVAGEVGVDEGGSPAAVGVVGVVGRARCRRLFHTSHFTVRMGSLTGGVCGRLTLMASIGERRKFEERSKEVKQFHALHGKLLLPKIGVHIAMGIEEQHKK